jgi:hypothetical protein
MKALSSSHAHHMGALMLALFVAWQACLGQADVGSLIGREYCCGKDPCDWHAVACKDAPGETCPTESEACCRGPDTGDGICSGIPGHQCDESGCVARGDEVCTE